MKPKAPKRTRAKRRQLALRFLPLIAPFMLSPVLAGGPSGTAVTKVPTTIEYTGFSNSMHDLYESMGLQSTGLRYTVFEKALTGYLNLKSTEKLSDKSILTIIDLELSSKKKRLWVIDLKQKDVLYYTYVSHGKNSGNEFAKQFSNTVDSNMSSPGFYVTKEIYNGKHGMSLKLEGLDEGFNTNALKRCIVMHGAEYASESTIKQLGFLGRSQGCPAIPVELHRDIINSVKGNTCLFVNAPVTNYTSRFLDQKTAVQEFLDSQNLM